MTAKIIQFPSHRSGARVIPLGSDLIISARLWAGGIIDLYRVELRFRGEVIAHDYIGGARADRLLGLALAVKLTCPVDAGIWFADAVEQTTDVLPFLLPAE